MNRADLTKQVLLYDQLAAAAKAKAAEARELLDTQAREELATQGMAPTWRMPDVGTITLPVTQEQFYIADANALMDWLAARWPVAIGLVRCIDPAHQRELEKRLSIAGDVVVDTATGEVVPGYGVRRGGLPLSLSIRPTGEAKALMRQHAEGLLQAFEATLPGEQVAE